MHKFQWLLCCNAALLHRTWRPALFDFNDVYSNREPSSKGAVSGIKNNGIAPPGYLPVPAPDKSIKRWLLVFEERGFIPNRAKRSECVALGVKNIGYYPILVMPVVCMNYTTVISRH